MNEWMSFFSCMGSLQIQNTLLTLLPFLSWLVGNLLLLHSYFIQLRKLVCDKVIDYTIKCRNLFVCYKDAIIKIKSFTQGTFIEL